MKIVHVVEDFSEANTGITSAVTQLSRVAIEHGHSVELVTIGAKAEPRIHGVGVRAAPCKSAFWAWRYSREFPGILEDAVDGHAVVHVHGVWMYPQWRAVRLAHEKGWPVVISSHNMFGGWLWRRGLLRRAKKRIYFELLLRRPFSKATIHALSEVERSVLATEFFPDSAVVRIPNALDLPSVDSALAACRQGEEPNPYLLFLGRLHPVKGIPLLIEAFRRLSSEFTKGHLIIAGPCESLQYERLLRGQVSEAGLDGQVEFAGPVFGERKWRLIRGATALCAPSFSEGISMAALEAMAAHLPVITTREAGLDDVEGGGGILVERTAESISNALLRAFGWREAERVERGNAARRLVDLKYSWPVVWPDYESLYKSLWNSRLPA